MTHELLAPAGNFEIFKAVLDSGADAVYLAGDRFGARAYASNFSEKELLEALDHAHLRGKKINLTVNTLMKNVEIERELYSYMEPLYKNGLDAVIVQDYGVFCFLKKHFPEMDLHISTQAGITGVEGARYFKNLGAARVVTARELSAEELKKIHDEVDIEIESFIHGALCYGYSGQCLMSSIIGGRSGNRGRCAQPCRLGYDVVDEKGELTDKKAKFPISLKDLCTIDILPSLMDAGVYSFKIEGRMKQITYAAGVTSVYRKYIDLYEEDPKGYKVLSSDMDYLMNLGNRSGFTQGYYFMHNDKSMITLKDSSHNSGKTEGYSLNANIGNKNRLSIDGYSVFNLDEPSSLTLVVPGTEISVSVTGDTVMKAEKRPLDEASIKERLKKTGDTPFEFNELEVYAGDDIFLPVGRINDLKRNALAELQDAILNSYKRKLSESIDIVNSDGKSYEKVVDIKAVENVVMIRDENTLDTVLSFDEINTVILDVDFRKTALLKKCVEKIHNADKKAAYVFPYFFRNDNAEEFNLPEFKKVGLDFIYARTYDSLGFAINTLGMDKKYVRLDQGVYTFSNTAKKGFADQGLTHHTVPYELNKKELAHIDNSNSEVVVYGNLPLMISANCVFKTTSGCKKKASNSNVIYLRDRYENDFKVVSDCDNCYNIIYNCKKYSLLDEMKLLRDMNFKAHRLSFTDESKDEIAYIIDSYLKGRPLNRDITKGHFNRGVQ